MFRTGNWVGNNVVGAWESSSGHFVSLCLRTHACFITSSFLNGYLRFSLAKKLRTTSAGGSGGVSVTFKALACCSREAPWG